MAVSFSEIVLSEGRGEALTSGPCRLVVPVPLEQLDSPASPPGRLTVLEVCIAKIFEVTIRNSTLPDGKCVSGIGRSDKLTWSIFVGASNSSGGQRFFGTFNIPRHLACEKAEEFGLATPESTWLNDSVTGPTEVAIPVLGIFGDEKVDKWKQFVKSFLETGRVSG